MYSNKDAAELYDQALDKLPFTYEEYLDFLAGYTEGFVLLSRIRVWGHFGISSRREFFDC